MNQDAFIEGKKQNWERLNILLDRARNGEGIKDFSAEDVQTLGSLYRRACSDLSYARSKQYDNDLVLYLNQLARRAYGIIYLGEQSKKGEVLRFFTREFPRLVRENFSYILAAILVFLAFTALGYILDRADPRYTYMLVPQEFLEIWDRAETLDRETSIGEMIQMSAWYFKHNFSVGLYAFILGITMGIGTFYMIANNGLMMGCLASLVLRSNYHERFFTFIISHAFIELMAIFICGGAGFLIARAMLAPGDMPVRDSLNVYGKKAVMLAVGTLPMFAAAGLTEAFVSHLPDTIFPFLYRALFGISTAVFMLFYFTYDPDKNRKSRVAAGR